MPISIDPCRSIAVMEVEGSPPTPLFNVQPKPVGGDSSFLLLLVKPGGTFYEILYSDSSHPIERDRNVPSILC